jgi:hypothetical protein
MSSPDPFRSILSLIGSRAFDTIRPKNLDILEAIRAVAPKTNMGDAILSPFGLSGPSILEDTRAPNPGRVMEELGILPQMAATDPDLAERLYLAIEPRAYSNVQYSPRDSVRLGKDGRAQTQSRAVRSLRAYLGLNNSPRLPASPEREDAWRLYLGLPQISQTFSVSQFRPSRASNQESVYLSMPNFLNKVVEYGLFREVTGTGAKFTRAMDSEGNSTPSAAIQTLVGLIDDKKKRIILNDNANGVMGNFTVGKGQDERGHYISYYDIWDLDPPRELPGAGLANRLGDRIGKPIEIYDRIYYNPETFEPIEVMQPPPRNSRGGGRPADRGSRR